MGSAQSLFTSQNLVAAIILVAVAATIWHNTSTIASGAPRSDKPAASKKGKKKKAVQETPDATLDKDKPRAQVTPLLSGRTIPGGMSEPAAHTDLPEIPKSVKEKKRKGRTSVTPVPTGTVSESATPVAGPSRPSTGSGSSVDPQVPKRPPTNPSTAESWTRVEPRRKSSGQNQTTSDAGVTTATSVDEDGSSIGALDESNRPQKTLAERVLPKGRKTAVDDMLESSHYPELSRVMRVAPITDDKPATGFSWGDYEDGEDVRGAEADGEDDGGWGVVKSRGKAKHHSQSSSGGVSTPQPKASETLTKKQRQNTAKREAAKVAKAEAEAERQAQLAKHKRELERTRIAEQYSRKGTNMRGRQVSGEMIASVNPEGKLVWD